jgi:zinc protease
VTPPAWPPLPLPEIRTGELPNGLRYTLIRRAEQPVLLLDLRIRAGGTLDPPERTGLSDFVASLLRHGTPGRTTEEISETLDSTGGNLSGEANTDYTAVRAGFLSRDFDLGLEILSEVARRPTFPPEEIEEIRRQTLSSIQREKDEAATLADQNLDYLVFGYESPFGRIETENTISSIRREDLVDFHHRYYRPGNAYMAVTGDIDFDRAEAGLAGRLGGWEAGEVPLRPAVPPARRAGIRIRLVDRPDLTQAYIAMGHTGPSRLDPDYIPVVLMNYTLGGGQFSSRLVKVVRGESGKTYDVNSSYSAWRDTGRFRVATFTRTAETGTTLDLVLREIGKMREGGPTREEFEKAKAFYIGSYPLQVETPGGLAERILFAELMGFGIDYVRNYRRLIGEVPLERAVAAAARWLRPEDLSICVVGRAGEIAGQLARFGPVETVNYLDPIYDHERAAGAREG